MVTANIDFQHRTLQAGSIQEGKENSTGEPMRSYFTHHAAQAPKNLERYKAEEVFKRVKGDDEVRGKGEMVAGAFHKLIIEEVCLLTPEVWQGLGLLFGVMADEGMQSFHH